jgi:hypothetical protein
MELRLRRRSSAREDGTMIWRQALGCIAVVAVVAAPSAEGASATDDGYVVTASVDFVTRGPPRRPTALTCTGTLGGTRLRGTPRAARGKATCLYRAPLSARGETLRGTISFIVSGKRYVRHFSRLLT